MNLIDDSNTTSPDSSVRCSIAWLAALAFAVTLGAPSTGHTYNLVDNEFKLDLSGIVEGGYVVNQPSTGGDLNYGPRLSLARLKLDGKLEDYGSVKIQTGTRDNNIALLDAVVALTAADPFKLQLGRFKSPVSHEFLTGAPDLLFFSRAALNSFVPGRRIGAQADYAFDATDNLTITPQVGLFEAPGGTTENPQGASVVGRILVEPGDSVDIHLAGAEFVFDENDVVSIGAPAPGYDQMVDAAVSYDTDRWNVHGEGLYVTGPADGVHYLAAGYAHAGHRLGDLEGISYEPAVGYDIFGTSEEDPNHRVTGGLNLYLYGDNLIASADYRLNLFDGDPGHTAILELQGQI